MNPRSVILGAIVTSVALLLASPQVEAKIFRNAYVSFELPDQWDCVLEGTEYVCRSQKNPQDSREAIIILTAKEAGPMDSLPAYQQHLQTPKLIPNRLGQQMQSQVVKVTQSMIANQPWADGMHLGSEIPNYYTRYMATVKDQVGILVTFSAHKRVYTKYSNDFFKAIQSLRVTVTKGLMAHPGDGPLRPGSETLGQNLQSAIPQDMMQDLPDEPTNGGSKMTNMLFGIAILMAAAGLYLLFKRKKR